MKIYGNNQDYSEIDQFVGTNIWVLAFYFNEYGAPSSAFVNLLSRRGDTITFKMIENMFLCGNVGDEEVWDFAWTDEEIFDVARNILDYGSEDGEIHKLSISESDFELEHPIQIFTTDEINEIIDTCYSDILRALGER